MRTAAAADKLRLFLGPDRPAKLRCLQELERSLGVDPLDRHRLDAGMVRSAELLALCRQRPALSPIRLVSVEQAQRLDAACCEALLELFQRGASAACVVLLVDVELPGRHALARAANSVTTEQFAGRSEPSPQPFGIADALARGDLPGALGALHEQLASGKEPLELLGLIAWQLQRRTLIKRLAGTGCQADQIASAMGLRLWQVQRLQAEAARWPLTTLQRQLSRCWQLDYRVKSGQIQPEVALDELVVELCLDARAGDPG